MQARAFSLGGNSSSVGMRRIRFRGCLFRQAGDLAPTALRMQAACSRMQDPASTVARAVPEVQILGIVVVLAIIFHFNRRPFRSRRSLPWRIPAAPEYPPCEPPAARRLPGSFRHPGQRIFRWRYLGPPDRRDPRHPSGRRSRDRGRRDVLVGKGIKIAARRAASSWSSCEVSITMGHVERARHPQDSRGVRGRRA